MSSILLIGPLTNKKNSSKSGGTVVLFELLLKELQEKKIAFNVIDTLKENYSNALFAYFSILFQLIKQVRKHEYISLHATLNSFVVIGPMIIFLSKVFGKKTSIRKFAGNFNDIYENSNKIKKKCIEYVLVNSNANFFETKYLVKYFSKFNKNTYWFPNVRRLELVPSLPRKFKKRFVYIGTIIEEKGIDELIDAISMIGNDYCVDIYGDIKDKKYSKIFFKEHNVTYKGPLVSNNVLQTMNSYDVLILPSHREGYPGVIIEAFSLAIPSIATKLEGILEMIEDNKNGLLIEVKNSHQLKNAILSMDETSYIKLSKNAGISFSDFNSLEQTNLFLKRVGLDV